MYVIAITGGIASGKSYVAQVLQEEGVPVLFADEVARALTSPKGAAASAVLRLFGTLDRKAIAASIFESPGKRAALNALVHPMVRRGLDDAILVLRTPLCAVEIPLLYESKMEDIAHEVWTVYVPPEEQLRRLMGRDGLTPEAALSRIQSQMPTSEKLRRADRGINASGEMEQTRRRVLALLQDAAARVGGHS